MRQQATAWVTGNVGTVPESSGEGATERVRFRVLSTPRRYDRPSGTWSDGEVSGIDVTCWNDLGRNVIASVRKGDPVAVHGRLEERRWTDREGNPRRTTQLVAEYVGHDLSRGTASFARTPRSSAPPVEEAAGAADGGLGTVLDPFDEAPPLPDPEGVGTPF